MNARAHSQFERAAEEFAAHPSSVRAIAAMMELAFESPSAAIKGWAAQWLLKTCNISVVEADKQEQDNAVAAAPEGVLR